LASLPYEIARLSLRKLDISFNQLAITSREVGNLYHLSELNLDDIQLKSIPPGIRRRHSFIHCVALKCKKVAVGNKKRKRAMSTTAPSADGALETGEEEEEEEEEELAPPTKKRPLPPSLLPSVELESTPRLDIFSWLIHPEDVSHLSPHSSDSGSISMSASKRSGFRLHPNLVPLMGRARVTRGSDTDDDDDDDDDTANENLRFRHINVGTFGDDHMFFGNNVMRVTVWVDDDDEEDECGDYRFELINWSAHIRPGGDDE
jgi:Leucine-rich repeat (LRR) protein